MGVDMKNTIDITEEVKELAINMAKDRLKDEDWFGGVCCDIFHKECESWESLGDLVNYLVFDTIYWDAPNMGFGE